MHLTNRAEIRALAKREAELFALYSQSTDAFFEATTPAAAIYWGNQRNLDFDCRQKVSGRLLDAQNKSVRIGVLARPGSAWVGVHWSGCNKRLCINLIPFVTVWVALPGGREP